MIKLRSLLKENKVSDYSFELGKYIMGLKPRIAGLKFDVEYHSGAWLWEKGDIAIYATWGWEGKKSVPIEIGYNEIGEEGDVVKTLRYNYTGDLKKDAQWYLSNMKRYLPGISKDYM